MADWMEIIKGRRSIRRFLEKPIPEESVNTVLEAARWSQSWANTQCWELVVIRDKGVREQLRQTVPPTNPAVKAIAAAPLLLAVCGKLQISGYYKGSTPTKFGDWFLFDLGLVTQNICLTAHALGLGTVVVGLFDHDRAKTILKAPDGCEPVALIPMGHPDQKPSPPKRREIKEFTHTDFF